MGTSPAFLSSTIGFTGFLPARVCELSRELSLSHRRGSDLLRGGGHRTAALGDVLDREHDLLGGDALLLAGELHLAADLGDCPHHGQTTLHLFDTLLQSHDCLSSLRLSHFHEPCDLGLCRLLTFCHPAPL